MNKDLIYRIIVDLVIEKENCKILIKKTMGTHSINKHNYSDRTQGEQRDQEKNTESKIMFS